MHDAIVFGCGFFSAVLLWANVRKLKQLAELRKLEKWIEARPPR